MVSDLAKEMLASAAKFPLWQQDAFRRLTLGRLTDKDYAELVVLAKREAGWALESTPEPLAASHLSSSHAATGSVVLAAMHSVVGVNALESGQRLVFGQTGITAVYGENGAGKSGYSRVLRKACRARKAPKIWHDVTQAGPAVAPTAKFDLHSIDGTTEVTWVDEQVSPDSLAHFAVFDRECEKGFIDEQEEPTFAPPILGSFEELAGVVTAVKRLLEEEEASARPTDLLNDVVNKVASFKSVADHVANVKADRTDSEYQATLTAVEKLVWTPQMQTHLTDHQRRLREAADPVSRAKSLRTLKASLFGIRTAAETCMKVLDDAATVALRQAQANAAATKEAAALATSAAQFLLEPAKDVGGQTWQELYRAAAKFATQGMGQGRGFPDTTPGGKCPLCLQGLGPEAVSRFERFKTFMTQETRSAAELAALAFQSAFASRQAAIIPAIDPHVAEQAAAQAPEAISVTDLDELGSQLRARKDAILTCAASGQWVELPQAPVAAVTKCIAAEDKLEQLAQSAEQLADPVVRAALQQNTSMLEASRVAADQRQRITGVLGQHRQAAALKRVHVGINTRLISLEGKAVTTRALTGGLQKAFEEELSALDATKLLKASIEPKTDKGKTRYSLAISAATPGVWRPSHVLSEGEQRVIAIAYFLAEARIAPDKVGLIIDDPVSSLDHRWAERIARRLAQLGLERQVIVFTHSIAFLLELERYATESSTPMSKLFISKTSGGAGHCGVEAEPWEKLRIKDRLKAFKAEAALLRAEHTTSPTGREYARRTAFLCGDLRAAWERGIEELIFNEVVERFGYAVMTKRLNGVVCTDETYKTVNNAMTRLSAIVAAHDRAKGAFAACPTPDDLDGFIATLSAFAKQQKDDLEKTVQVRKAFDKPPASAATP